MALNWIILETYIHTSPCLKFGMQNCSSQSILVKIYISNFLSR